MEIILYLFFVILFFGILYCVIQSAIDGSKTAEEIRMIRMILQKQYEKSSEQNIQSDNNYEVMDIPYNVCPACGATLASEDSTCPSCGLNLNGKNG
ncbi:zinc ribbon domain-containing protein [Ruminiclostridium josui]|uniref:zinc ribbon domain-containing protein n=1 Tax=Ruminiclostridium josui TaxID=1499 RepID=UPI000465CD6A|nr:zinc ribbon domain-containing protein [Ruminiclostridium josui]